MFARLFAESGLSLDRLRALVEVGAAGSIVQAAPAAPIRQSQLSRQIWKGHEPSLTCGNFLDAREALAEGRVAALLPDFLTGTAGVEACSVVRIPGISSLTFQHRFCWNPRLLRLNPQAIRRRDYLAENLRAGLRRQRGSWVY